MKRGDTKMNVIGQWFVFKLIRKSCKDVCCHMRVFTGWTSVGAENGSISMTKGAMQCVNLSVQQVSNYNICIPLWGFTMHQKGQTLQHAQSSNLLPTLSFHAKTSASSSILSIWHWTSGKQDEQGLGREGLCCKFKMVRGLFFDYLLDLATMSTSSSVSSLTWGWKIWRWWALQYTWPSCEE